jgi:DNA-directed RNA polymerase subunit RPC12/RpoP
MVKEPRCPYCVLIDDFMLLSPTGDGLFVCVKCGHVAIPENKLFQCFCRHCSAMRAFEPAKPQSWSVQKSVNW